LGIMKKGNIFKRMKNYLTDVRGELKKVTWPSFSDMQKTTIAVIVLSIIFGIYLTGVDVVLRSIVNKVIEVFR
jgi:preprotein translocase subunit SecE